MAPAAPISTSIGTIRMKIVIIVTAGLVAMLSVAAAADLPRKEPPPVAAAAIGKYPVGQYPVGKSPVGKYPQPVVTKGSGKRSPAGHPHRAVLPHPADRCPQLPQL